MEQILDYYVLFHTHTEGLKLYQYIRERGITVRISPAPRVASVCCGMSLLAEAEAIEAVRRCISESGVQIDRVVALPRQIDPTRDKYC
ncbi:MAG: DUF3343 domain-containing protein [Bacillota bacterium]